MANQTTWVFDPTHSEITFKVKHLMITNVKGSFTKFDANLVTSDDDFKTASATGSIDVSSVSTNNDDRDNHLKSADFFDADHFKTIDFVSTSIEKLDAENGKLNGKLTIKGITKDVSFDIEFGGISKDPWGNIKTGFSLNGVVNRDDFGLNWNAALETGGFLLGNEIKVSGEFQFSK